MSFTTIALITGLITFMVIVFIVALSSATGKDYEDYELSQREKYYVRILKKSKEQKT